MPSTGPNSKLKQKILSIRLSSDGLSFWTTGVSAAPAGCIYDFIADYGTESEERFVAFRSGRSMEENVRSAVREALGVAGWTVRVDVMPETSRTVLVPTGIFVEEQTEQYLRINNIVPDPDEQAVIAEISDGPESKKAVIVCNKALLNILRELLGDKMSIASPFEVAARINEKYFGAGAGTAGTRKLHKKYRKFIGRDCASMYLCGQNVYIVVLEAGGGWKFCDVLPYSSAAELQFYMRELSARFGITGSPLFIKGIGAKAASKALRRTFRNCVCE